MICHLFCEIHILIDWVTPASQGAKDMSKRQAVRPSSRVIPRQRAPSATSALTRTDSWSLCNAPAQRLQWHCRRLHCEFLPMLSMSLWWPSTSRLAACQRLTCEGMAPTCHTCPSLYQRMSVASPDRAALSMCPLAHTLATPRCPAHCVA